LHSSKGLREDEARIQQNKREEKIKDKLNKKAPKVKNNCGSTIKVDKA